MHVRRFVCRMCFISLQACSSCQIHLTRLLSAIHGQILCLSSVRTKRRHIMLHFDEAQEPCKYTIFDLNPAGRSLLVPILNTNRDCALRSRLQRNGCSDLVLFAMRTTPGIVLMGRDDRGLQFFFIPSQGHGDNTASSSQVTHISPTSAEDIRTPSWQGALLVFLQA